MVKQIIGTVYCLQFLQAMELNENEDEDLEDQVESDIPHTDQDDEVSILLPEEWIFEFQDKSLSHNLRDETSDSALRIFREQSQSELCGAEKNLDTQSQSAGELEILGAVILVDTAYHVLAISGAAGCHRKHKKLLNQHHISWTDTYQAYFKKFHTLATNCFTAKL